MRATGCVDRPSAKEIAGMPKLCGPWINRQHGISVVWAREAPAPIWPDPESIVGYPEVIHPAV